MHAIDFIAKKNILEKDIYPQNIPRKLFRYLRQLSQAFLIIEYFCI